MKVKYKNWSINKKLLSISLSAFLPMVILAAYLIVSLNNAASAYSEITKSIAYANRYVKDFKSRLDYSVYLAVVSNKQLKEVGDGVTTVNGVVTVISATVVPPKLMRLLRKRWAKSRKAPELPNLI